MLNDVKKVLGINNTQFDTILNGYIDSAKEDLLSVGIASSLIDLLVDGATLPTDNKKYQLVKMAVITYCQAQYESEKKDLYTNAYESQKDNLRRKADFQEPVGTDEEE